MVTTSGNLDTQAHVLHMIVCVTWALIWERTDTWKVTDIGQDLDSPLSSVHSVVHDYLDYRMLYTHWITQNLPDIHQLSNFFYLAMKVSIFGSALLQGMRHGLITWHPKPKKSMKDLETPMFRPATKSTTIPSVGEIMVTAVWSHTNVFLMDFLDICYPFAMCTSKSEQSSWHQDFCYPTFWNCFSVCDRTNNFLIVCLVQLWSTCC